MEKLDSSNVSFMERGVRMGEITSLAQTPSVSREMGVLDWKVESVPPPRLFPPVNRAASLASGEAFWDWPALDNLRVFSSSQTTHSWSPEMRLAF